jgi:enamine deaminase RidA (YjgF/YER057c/UK114 family)
MTERQAFVVDPAEPYSKVIKAGGLVFVKSQIGTDSAGKCPSDIAAQTRNTLENLEHALDLAGSTLANALKVNVYLSHIDRDFEGMDESYLRVFAEKGIVERPARTAIGTPLSWPQLLVQMDLLAVES